MNYILQLWCYYYKFTVPRLLQLIFLLKCHQSLVSNWDFCQDSCTLHACHPLQPPPWNSGAAHKCHVLFGQVNIISDHNPGNNYVTHINVFAVVYKSYFEVTGLVLLIKVWGGGGSVSPAANRRLPVLFEIVSAHQSHHHPCLHY